MAVAATRSSSHKRSRRADPTHPLAHLTSREWEVLVLLCLRQTNAEIATRLCVSTRTVEAHVASILQKLGAANRREAGAIATRYGAL